MPGYRVQTVPLPIFGVFVGESGKDFDDLNRIFHQRGWRLSRADNWACAQTDPCAAVATHFIYQHVPQNRAWIQAIGEIATLPRSPAFILASRFADEELWMDVLSLGGYDLLLQPFTEFEVHRVVSCAWQQTGSRRKLLLSAISR